MIQQLSSLRNRLFHLLNPSAKDQVSLSWLNKLIIFFILGSVLIAILESEPTILNGRQSLFKAFEYVFGIFFMAEYIARVWVSVEDPRYAGGIRGRLRYMVSLTALLDLLAIAPLIFLFIGTEAYMLRLFRLLRVLRLAKLGRFSNAMTAISEAVKSRRFKLLASGGFALTLLLITSTLMYLLEAEIQPEIFGSIPRAMWWSVVTLTTVGYGDSFPVTVGGRILAGLTAVTGIGLIAMPTGILAAAFSDALQARRAHAEAHPEKNKSGHA